MKIKIRILAILLAALILFGGTSTLAAQTAETAPAQAEAAHTAYLFGDNHGNFRPNAIITRAEVAAILARTHIPNFNPNQLPPGMTTFDTFPYDVHPGQWWYNYIAWAYHAELIIGSQITPEFPIRRYRPQDPITRRELATILVRASGHEVLQPSLAATQIPDLYPDGAWAVNYIYTAWHHGLLQGDHHGNMRPLANITRAEVAVAINRLTGRLSDTPANQVTIQNQTQARTFPDVASNTWYTLPVLIATNNHTVRQSGTTAIVRILP